MVDSTIGKTYTEGADRNEKRFVVLRLRRDDGVVDWEQIQFARRLLQASIPDGLLLTYAEAYCRHFNLTLRRQTEEPQKLSFVGWNYSSATLEYLRSPIIIDQLQKLLHVRVPQSPPPHMMRILEGACIWLVEHLRAARTMRDADAYAGYTVALMLAPKLLLP